MPHRSCRALSAGLALVLALAAGPVRAGAAEFLQSFVWSSPETTFGGFSGLELTDNGKGFVALSDRGTLWRGTIARDGAGQITALTTRGPVVLHDSAAKPVAGWAGDSEGLALAADGSVFVSFEGLARVAHYPADAGPARKLPRPKAFARFQANSALEALAIAPDGTLYTLPERSGQRDLPFEVWRFRGGAWSQPFTLPRDGDWLPVGADFGPDGRFYLLERDFWGILGFLSRVRVFTIAGDRLSGGEVLLQTGAGRHDNLEGISVWRDGSGALRLTLISDDNFSLFQRSELVEYRLAP